MLKKIPYLLSFFIIINSVTTLDATITIDVDLPNNLKDSLANIQTQIQQCYKQIGCFPNKVEKKDLQLTIQLISQKELSSGQMANLKQALQTAVQQVASFSITIDPNKARFELLGYTGNAPWLGLRTGKPQFQGAWVGFTVDPQSNELNMFLTILQQEFSKLNLPYQVTMGQAYITVGFTRFVSIREYLKKLTIKFPQTSTVTIDKINITQTTLIQQRARGSTDRIAISKQTIGTYQLSVQIFPLQMLKNNLTILQQKLMQLEGQLNKLS